MSPPSLPSAEAGEQELELPDLTCTPTTTDVELVRDYLCPAIRRMRDLGRARVSTDLPGMDPCELPGMIARNNKGRGGGGGGVMRDKYYLTDRTDLRFFHQDFSGVRTTSGIWQKHAPATAIRAEHKRMVGVKRTMRFYQYPGAKTNWIMNIYYSFKEGNSFLQDGLVLCHVFETDSPDYDDNYPKCLGCHRGACSGHHHDQEFRAPSQDNSFNSTQPGYWPTNYYPPRHSDPRLMSYIEQLGNLLLSDSDPDNSADTGNSGATRGEPPMADHGQSKKRKKGSDVWDYFTKIFARDINGKVVTYAACNHCCKILSASSKNGTSPLARHAVPCKFKPVAAGRSAKDSGGDVNVLSS